MNNKHQEAEHSHQGMNAATQAAAKPTRVATLLEQQLEEGLHLLPMDFSQRQQELKSEFEEV